MVLVVKRLAANLHFQRHIEFEMELAIEPPVIGERGADHAVEPRLANGLLQQPPARGRFVETEQAFSGGIGRKNALQVIKRDDCNRSCAENPLNLAKAFLRE